ncbi:MAG TPA: DUF6036 family nucleotidyltransferase [Actinomycetota bacterium]|nr:DUF6036 family nucleotidyltransferase [Actinomycetota bacterium]
MPLFEPVFAALDAAGVRYVVVGGVAVVLHGHARLTADLDIAIDLTPDAARAAIVALEGLGLRARLPIAPAGLADPATRRSWIEERGMRVFSMWDPEQPLVSVDIFVEDLIDFDGLWERAVDVDLGGSRPRVASIADLIHLKRMADRPQDRADIEALEAIASARGERS